MTKPKKVVLYLDAKTIHGVDEALNMSEYALRYHLQGRGRDRNAYVMQADVIIRKHIKVLESLKYAILDEYYKAPWYTRVVQKTRLYWRYWRSNV